LLLPTLFLCSIFIILLITKPWITLPIMGVIYIATIPISIYKYSKNA
jgi:CDP-diacylglycerol--serine O-phosphatidyltransferase